MVHGRFQNGDDNGQNFHNRGCHCVDDHYQRHCCTDSDQHTHLNIADNLTSTTVAMVTATPAAVPPNLKHPRHDCLPSSSCYFDVLCTSEDPGNNWLHHDAR
jgi:hypothetical protein